MPRVTAYLVSWPGGWHWEHDSAAPIRIEAALGLTAQTLPEVRLLAQAELDTYGQGQEELTVATDPGLTGPRAAVDYRVGDTVTIDGQQRVVEAIAYRFDDETGRIIRVPQFGTIFDSPARRAQRIAERHQIGAVTGTSHLATPVAEIPPRDPVIVTGGVG